MPAIIFSIAGMARSSGRIILRPNHVDRNDDQAPKIIMDFLCMDPNPNFTRDPQKNGKADGLNQAERI